MTDRMDQADADIMKGRTLLTREVRAASFAYGGTRAHVMEWSNTRELWEPLCSRPSPVVKPADYWNRPDEEWPLRTAMVDERLVPWCSQCVRAVRSRVQRLSWDVLEPAARESSAVSS